MNEGKVFVCLCVCMRERGAGAIRVFLAPAAQARRKWHTRGCHRRGREEMLSSHPQSLSSHHPSLPGLYNLPFIFFFNPHTHTHTPSPSLRLSCLPASLYLCVLSVLCRPLHCLAGLSINMTRTDLLQTVISVWYLQFFKKKKEHKKSKGSS